MAGFYIAVNQPRVQTWLTQTVASVLSSKLNTEVTVGSVHIKFFKRLEVRDVYIEDQQGDTLLYAQRLYASIGKFQPFKNRYDIKKLELKGAYVNLYRMPAHEEFNYTFILDSLFNADNKTDSELPVVDLSLREVLVSDLRFNLNDSIAEQNMSVSLTKLGVAIDELDLPNKKIRFRSFGLNDANIAILDFRPAMDSTQAPTAQASVSGPSSFNPDCWQIDVANVEITNTNFSYLQSRYERDTRGIDYHNIVVNDINLQIIEVSLFEDTLNAWIDHIAANEISGFQLDQLSAHAILTPGLLEFEDLYLKTPHSEVTNYYSMRFNSFADFGKYEKAVYMRGLFNKATVSFIDINYFAKVLPFLAHNTVNLTGEVKGTVSGLKGNNLEIDFGKFSKFAGDFSLYGLPNFSETFISFDIDRITTSGREITAFYNGFNLPPEMDKFGRVRFSGNFDGFYNDFVAEGNLQTAIGELESDINFKVDPVTGLAKYKGNFSANKFDLGKWTENEEMLGTITVAGKLNGSGMKVSNINAFADGVVESITVKGYEYHNIDLNGEFSERLFNGSLNINDPNLTMSFNGNIDLEDSVPIFAFVADVDTANLQALNLTSYPLSFSSKLDLNLTGSTIDDIQGSLAIRNSHITKSGEYFWLDSLSITSDYHGANRSINIESDIVRGWVKGEYTFSTLPQSFQIFLNHYFQPGYKTPGADSIPPQNFTYSIQLDDTRNLTKLILPQITNIEGGIISGHFISDDQKFKFKASIPSVHLLDIKWSGINFDFQSSEQHVNFASSIDTIFITDSLYTNQLIVNGGIIKDSVVFNVSLEDSSSENHLTLNGTLKSDLVNYQAHFTNSFLKIKNQIWELNDNNTIDFDGQNLDITDLTISNNNNFIAVSSEVVNEHTNLQLQFKDVRLANIIPGADKLNLLGATFDGLMNGSVNIIKVFKQPALSSYVTIDSLLLNNILVGDLKFTSNYLNNADYINTRLILEGNNKLMIAGTYNLVDKKNSLDLTCNIDSLQLPLVEHFVSKYVSKIMGQAYGKVSVTGNIMQPLVNGYINLKQGQVLINYLNTKYHFADERFVFEDKKIVLDKVVLTDARNHTATATGYLGHTYFRDMRFAIEVETKNFQFLNTNAASAESYFGQVYAGGYVFIGGTPKLVDFYAAATTKPETKFFLSVNSSKDVDSYSFYQFINKDTTNGKNNINGRFEVKNNGIKLNFDIEATTDAEVNLILSEEQGDIITARGKGNLVMELDEFGDMTMVGNYVMETGDYTFTMQNVINKKFEIAKGSQIMWTGDPYDARLSINAVYKLRAAPYDLIEDVVKDDTPLQQSRNRVPVYLYLKLYGSLLTPDISFDIDVPETDPGIRSALDAKIALIKTDQNELNKQVVGLLVLNRFLPVYPVGGGENNFVDGLNNTVSEFVSNQLSLYLTDWISKFVTEVELDINYRDYQNEITGADDQIDFQNRRELQLALTKSFFNDRVEIDIGGNFDFGEAANNGTEPGGDNPTRSSNIAGDFEIRYKITSEGRIKLKVFRKGEYDVFQERNRNKTGVGIAYKQEFETVRELIKYNRDKRKNRRTRRSNRKNPPVEPDAATTENEE